MPFLDRFVAQVSFAWHQVYWIGLGHGVRRHAQALLRRWSWKTPEQHRATQVGRSKTSVIFSSSIHDPKGSQGVAWGFAKYIDEALCLTDRACLFCKAHRWNQWKPWSPAKTNIAQPEKKKKCETNTALVNGHLGRDLCLGPLGPAKRFRPTCCCPTACADSAEPRICWNSNDTYKILQAWPDLKNRTPERCQLIISPNVNVFLAGKTLPSNPHLPPGGLILVMSTSMILQPQCRQRHALQLHQFQSAPHISRGKSTQFSA